MSILLIIDMQNDFCEGGTMSSNKSLEIIPVINRIKKLFDIKVFTKDWHPANHSSFKKFGGTCNTHCIENTQGAKLHSSINYENNDLIILKGTLQKFQPYSAFFDAKDTDKQTNLNDILFTNNIKDVYICGIGIDDCIFSTALDCIKFGYNCFIIDDAISYFNETNMKKAKDYLISMDIKFVNSVDLTKQEKIE